MNETIVYVKVNAPRIHQAIIAKLITGLTNLYLQDKTSLFAYPETMIDEGQTGPTPDIMLVNSETELTETIIEITHTQGVKKDTQKLKELMQTYDVKEGFVYDYKFNLWHRYLLENLDYAENSSYCQAVDCELSKFLF
ncbi:MAG: hypothetical protein U0X91_25990 [Spirosomataceae bacterium]